MSLHAPTPGTDREYLVEIYAALNRLNDRFTALPCIGNNARITAMERWQWKATGGLSLLTFGIGIVGSIVVNHLFHLVN